MTEHPLPGGVGISKLCVYDAGGTPHLHLCCTEAYVVMAGAGAVQTLTLKGGFAETPLRPGSVVWFTPGTIHRLVNGGALEIVVLMQNSGLPEAGDAVLTLRTGVVDDPAAYADAVALPDGGAASGDITAAYRRREAALAGFAVLRDALARGDDRPLRDFHAAAARLVAPRLAQWRERWASGALRTAQETGEQLAALAEGSPAHLADAAVFERAAPLESQRRGMCGLLETYRIGEIR
jgi:mannose-6-phosphate isomerase-like protein (cupin superfamily)